MDALTELLADAGLQRRLLNVRDVPPDRALRFPCDRSVGFHVVLQGAVFVHAPTIAQPLALGPGDIALMGRGCEHRISASRDADSQIVDTMSLEGSRRFSGSAAASMVSGAYQLWHTPLHPFFSQLPPWFVLRAGTITPTEPLGTIVALLTAEAQRDEIGRDTVVHGLLDALFALIIRAVLQQTGDTAVGWSHAIHDPQVRDAVMQLHQDCARGWTLDALARSVGLSRSALAVRFRAAMGDTPLAYLRTVRLQRAMRLLTEHTHTLEQVAQRVGYHDAFSFSKAFKRAIGRSPGEYRRQDLAERQAPWRFRADSVMHHA